MRNELKSTEACPASMSQVFMTKQSLERLFIQTEEVVNMHLEKHGYLETMAFLVSDRDDNVINHTIVPYHVMHRGYCEIPVDTEQTKLKELIKNINRDREKKYRVIGWGHSHPDFNAFSSGTDDNEHRTVLSQAGVYDKIDEECPSCGTIVVHRSIRYAVGLTVNLNRDIYAVVITNYNCGRVEECSNARVKVVDPDTILTNEWIKETREEIRKKIEERAEIYVSSYSRHRDRSMFRTGKTKQLTLDRLLSPPTSWNVSEGSTITADDLVSEIRNTVPVASILADTIMNRNGMIERFIIRHNIPLVELTSLMQKIIDDARTMILDDVDTIVRGDEDDSNVTEAEEPASLEPIDIENDDVDDEEVRHALQEIDSDEELIMPCKTPFSKLNQVFKKIVGSINGSMTRMKLNDMEALKTYIISNDVLTEGEYQTFVRNPRSFYKPLRMAGII